MPTKLQFQDINASPDPKTDEVDCISVEGTMRYLADLGINMESAEFLVPLEIVQAPALGEITKDGFVDGWKNINGKVQRFLSSRYSANSLLVRHPTQ